MELQKQVCSLELAKRLKKLGLKQESIFYWDFYHVSFFGDWPRIISRNDRADRPAADADRMYAAFTVAELGEMLPAYNWQYPYTFKMSSQTEWSSVWLSAKNQRIEKQFTANTEADARAKMLVYLLENKLMASAS
jgi:hypothetical protein